MNVVKIAFEKGYRVDASGKAFGPKGALAPQHKDGYSAFGIKLGGRNRRVMVHRLKAFQLFGDQMFCDGIQVRHLDGNKSNNSDGNIAIGTASENQMDKPESVRRRVAGDANRKHDHSAILLKFKNSGFMATLREFGIGRGALSFIINKSIAANAA